MPVGPARECSPPRWLSHSRLTLRQIDSAHALVGVSVRLTALKMRLDETNARVYEEIGLMLSRRRQKRPALANPLIACNSAVINQEDAAEKATKASQATAELVDKAPDAIKKLKERGNDVAKLTMPEIAAIAFTSFNGTTLKGKKEDLVKGLQSLISKQPNVLNLGVLPAIAVAPAAPPPAIMPPAEMPPIPPPAVPPPVPSPTPTSMKAAPSSPPLPLMPAIC